MKETTLQKAKDDLMDYLKWNKDICWDINSGCSECCGCNKNCAIQLRDLIDSVQNQFSN